MRYRKKPVVVEARQYTGDASYQAIKVWSDGIVSYSEKDGVTCKTLEGRLHISEGDWIICGVNGEFYPCKPDIFQATYEPVEVEAER